MPASMDLASHARFFDHLVELVPAKYYLATDTEQVNLKYMKKSARDAAKAAFKQQHKQNKRAKLDPDQAKTTLELQKAAAAAKQAQGGAAESDTDDSGGEEDNDSEGAAPEPQAAAVGPAAAGKLALPTGAGRGAEWEPCSLLAVLSARDLKLVA